MSTSKNQYNVLSLLQEQKAADPDEVTAADFFAGGGGVSEALYNMPGVDLRWILNHDNVAVNTNSFHHPEIKTYLADIYVQDEHELEPVDLVWASIECTQHSRAKGGKDKELGSYTMGWELERYIAYLNPLVIGIENVPEFKKWSPVCKNGNPIKAEEGSEFERWKARICSYGYKYTESIREAANDGLPTRRVRYFAFFYREGINVSFPAHTHSKGGKNGLKKWLPCRPHIDLTNEGTSIFGRELNQELPAHLRKKLSPNTLRRIAGGIKKYAPDLHQFICNCYGGEKGSHRTQSLDDPLFAIPCRNIHQLVTLKEKIQFIQDHCHTDNYHDLDEPMNPQLTRQTKQLVQFISQYYGGSDQTQSVEDPLNTVTCKDRHQLDTVLLEKVQFIAHYFNGNGSPESQHQSLESPLNAVLTNNKAALISILEGFDIKTRFLNREELASCMTFPRDYYSKPGLKLSNKAAVKMIGNAVPPEWAKLLIAPIIPEIKAYKRRQRSA